MLVRDIFDRLLLHLYNILFVSSLSHLLFYSFFSIQCSCSLSFYFYFFGRLFIYFFFIWFDFSFPKTWKRSKYRHKCTAHTNTYTETKIHMLYSSFLYMLSMYKILLYIDICIIVYCISRAMIQYCVPFSIRLLLSWKSV